MKNNASAKEKSNASAKEKNNASAKEKSNASGNEKNNASATEKNNMEKRANCEPNKAPKLTKYEEERLKILASNKENCRQRVLRTV